MGWDEYARSKVPLKLVFITIAAVAVNLLIIGAFQLIAMYRYTGPIDGTVLGRMNGEYENCTILDSREYSQKEHSVFGSDYSAYLLETEDGEMRFAVVEKHLLFDRYRYVKKLSADVPEAAGTQDIHPGTAFQSAWAAIGDNSRIITFSVSQNNSNSLFFILLAMCVVELIAYCLLFKRDELL